MTMTTKLASSDNQWLEESLRQNPRALSHALLNGRTLITAPTDELQQFVVKHRDRFTATIDLQRQTGVF
jgi:hypothetical protein